MKLPSFGTQSNRDKGVKRAERSEPPQTLVGWVSGKPITEKYCTYCGGKLVLKQVVDWWWQCENITRDMAGGPHDYYALREMPPKPKIRYDAYTGERIE